MKAVKPGFAARRLACAVGAALAGLGGAAYAAESGIVTSRSGNEVRTQYGECWQGGSRSAQADVDCPPAAQATPTSAVGASASGEERSAAAGATSGASAAGAGRPASGAPAREPGYVNLTDGVNVRTAYGECWRAGHWTPAMAAAPCDAVARASTPARVVAAQPQPEPTPAPAPEPQSLVEAEPLPLIQTITIEADVLFAFDKAQLRPSGRDELDKVAGQLRDARVEEVIAIGHTDPIGTEQYNEKLSRERAAAVKEYLVQQGIESTKVITEGRGESQLVTNGQCRGQKGPKLIACLQPDRRVEIEIYGSREVAASETAPAAGATTSPSTAGAAGGASGGASSGTSGGSGSSN